jgi:DNA polymerase I-like protein with 3'-5' exonuclease and polymerase domains
MFHDELLVSCPPDIADEIGQLGVKSIVKAGEYLKLRVPLDAEYKIGKSWRETH